MSKVNVLVVEDEFIIANYIKKTLRDLGYEVPAVASTGEDAIKKAGEFNPDIVLMDIVLKGEMDGIQAAYQICSRYKIPIIYLTAYEDEDTLDRAKITEPLGYILKPFQESDLHITLEMALYKHAMGIKLRENEKQFRALAEHSPDGIIIEINKRITYVNPAALKLLSETEVAKLHGKSVFDFLEPGKLESFKQKSIRAEEIPSVSFIKEKIIRRDGTKFDVEIAMIPIVHDGEIALQVILRDITKK